MGSPASPKLTEAPLCGNLIEITEDDQATQMAQTAIAALSKQRAGNLYVKAAFFSYSAAMVFVGMMSAKGWARGLHYGVSYMSFTDPANRAYLATLGRERDDAMTTHPDSDRRG